MNVEKDMKHESRGYTISDRCPRRNTHKVKKSVIGNRYANSVNPSRPNPGQREKIKLNFHFHPSLRCLNRYCEDLKGTANKCEHKNLT